ncbi:MAG: hypothetical protein JWL68_1827 [Actinomycetia bacterium]|nr:hypothetical protein [Actinomycetes bacterium]
MKITLVEGDITRIALAAVRQAGPAVEEVRFVLFGQEMHGIFSAALSG